MHFLIISICVFMQTTSPNQPAYEQEGMMPEVVVTAPRSECEDEAWAAMMPEVIATAPSAAPAQIIDLIKIQPRAMQLGLESDPKFAIAEAADAIEEAPVGLTFSGNYNLAPGDTVDEDVTVSGGNAHIEGVIDGDLAVMGGTVNVSGMVDGDVVVFGGNLDILGVITGDAAVFGGHILNKGRIEGDLAVIGGTVTLDSGSVIEGDINMVGGSVERDTAATVMGKIESIEMGALENILPRIGRIGRVFRWTGNMPGRGWLAGFIGLSVLVVFYIINLLAFLIFPGSIKTVTERIEENVWASVGLGLGIQILFIPLVVLFAVSIIGIPLIPVFMLAISIAVIFGLSSLANIIGLRLAHGLNQKTESRAGLFTIGWVALMALMIIGFILKIVGLNLPIAFAFGGIIIYVAMTIGLGGVLFTLLKRRNKPDKK